MKYSDELAERIYEALARSGSMREVCRLPDMPDRRMISRWMVEDPDFCAKCARAKAIGIDEYVEQTIEIADAFMEPNEVPQAKLRIETRRWLAERMLPKVYGPKAGLELSGTVEMSKLSDGELDAEIAALTKRVALLTPADDSAD